jgi:hypothetical protein
MSRLNLMQYWNEYDKKPPPPHIGILLAALQGMIDMAYSEGYQDAFRVGVLEEKDCTYG